MKRRFHSLALAIAMGTTTLLASPVAPFIPSALAADPITGTVTTLPATDINKKGATLSGTYSGDMSAVTDAGIMFGGKATQMLVGYKVTPNGSTITKVIANWPDKTTYYYQAYVVVGGKKIFGNVESVTTGTPTITGKVITGDATNITNKRALITGSFENMNMAVQEVGIAYGFKPDSWVVRLPHDKVENPFSHTTLNQLPAGTTVYYTTYALVGNTYVYGDFKSFRTLDDPTTLCKVATGGLVNIDGDVATVSASFTGLESGNISSSGVIYDTDPSLDTFRIALGSGNTFEAKLTYLHYEKTYYYKAFVISDGYKIYGEVKSFTMPKAPKAIANGNIMSVGVTDIDDTNATLGGYFDSFNYPVTACGFEYGTNEDLNGCTKVNAEVKWFSKMLTGLKPDTTYYWRSFIVADGQTFYGSILSFETDSSLPKGTVLTDAAKGINETGATLSGSYADFGFPVTEVGFEYGQSNGGLLRDYTVAKMGDSFTADLNDLDPSTTYYFRSYAVCEGVRIYGNIQSFTTSAVAPKIKAVASVTTGALVKSAKGGTISGSFANIENAAEIGFEYSQNADMSNAVKDDVAMGGNFSASVSKAMLHFGFYYRAYVVADGQTYYGTINMAK